MRTWRASRSRSEYTATVAMPSSRQVRMTRTAISPRLAMRTLSNRGFVVGCDIAARTVSVRARDLRCAPVRVDRLDEHVGDGGGPGGRCGRVGGGGRPPDRRPGAARAGGGGAPRGGPAPDRAAAP